MMLKAGVTRTSSLGSHGLDQIDEARHVAGLPTDPSAIHISILPDEDE